jgi:hypothetical protein
MGFKIYILKGVTMKTVKTVFVFMEMKNGVLSEPWGSLYSEKENKYYSFDETFPTREKAIDYLNHVVNISDIHYWWVGEFYLIEKVVID